MNYQEKFEELSAEHSLLKNQMQLIRDVVTTTSYNLGDKFFETIVKHLNNALNADYTFIGELYNNNTIETIALCGDNRILENFAYNLINTPCENVIGNTVCCYPERVNELFPDDVLLQDMGIKGYIGVPLFNTQQQPNGILVSLFKEKIPDPSIIESILLIFASQAGSELEHKIIYKNLTQTQSKLITKNKEYEELTKKQELQYRELFVLESELNQLNEQLFTANEVLISREQQISIKNNRLSNLINNLPSGLLIESTKGNIEIVNQKLCDLFSLTSPPATLAGANLLQLMQSTKDIFQDSNKFITLIKRISYSEEPLLQQELKLKNGKIYELEFRPVVLENAFTEKLWIFRDITDRKTAEWELHTTQMHYTDFINNSTDLVSYWKVPDGISDNIPIEQQVQKIYQSICIDANLKATKIFGKDTRNEVIGVEYSSLVNTKTLDSTLLQFVQNGYKLDNLEVEQSFRGTDIYYGIDSLYGVIVDGFLKYIWAISKDITDRKMAEIALKENQQQLQLIFDSSPAIMLLVNEKTEIIKVNNTGLQFTNYSASEVINMKSGDLFGCVHAIKQPNVCGQTAECKNCTIRNTLNETITTNKTNTKVEASLTVNKNNVVKELHVLISTTIATSTPTPTYLITIDDITDRKITEEKLRLQEEHFRLMVENMPVMINAYDQDGNFIFWNKKCEQVTGYTSDEVIGSKMVMNKLYPDNDYRQLKIDNYQNKLDEVSNLEIDLINKAGAKKTVLWSNINKPAPLKNWAGWEIGIEITERKKIELALEESLTKFKTLADHTYDWEYWKDIDGNFIYLSPSCERISGYTEQEFINNPDLFGSIISNSKEEWTSHIKNANNQVACEHPIEFEIRTKNGRRKWINHVCRPVYDKSGVYIGNRGTNRDITIQKLSQMAMEQSEVRFRQLADLTFEGIVIHKNGIAQDLNKAFLTMTGYKVDELLGKDLVKLLIPERHLPLINDRLKNHYGGTTELEIIIKNGDIIPVEIISRQLTEGEDGIRVASFRNISEQKELQRKILNTVIQTEELERKRMSQELHDGLGPILSTIKLYTETYMSSTNEEFKEKIKTQLLLGINEALEQSSSISNNLSPHVLKDFGLKVALQKFIDKITTLGNIEIDFTFNYSFTINKEVEITAYRVAIELLNNTLKHANANIVKLEVSGNKEEITLGYTDNGIGFDFNKTKALKKGMGLFNIVNRIESLGGTMLFDRSNGSSFHISIPNKSVSKNK